MSPGDSQLPPNLGHELTHCRRSQGQNSTMRLLGVPNHHTPLAGATQRTRLPCRRCGCPCATSSVPTRTAHGYALRSCFMRSRALARVSLRHGPSGALESRTRRCPQLRQSPRTRRQNHRYDCSCATCGSADPIPSSLLPTHPAHQLTRRHGGKEKARSVRILRVSEQYIAWQRG